MKTKWVGFVVAVAGMALSARGLLAADHMGAGETDPESFHVEVTGSAWILDTAGTLHDSGTLIDLRSDLGFQQQQATFWGKLVFKPGRKHRIFVEGAPLADNGLQAINRSITYSGQTFNISETIKSNVNLNMVFAGYQYDIVSNSYGHVGISGGGAYLDGTGTLTSLQDPTSSTGNYQIGLPLAGVDVRLYPIPSHKWLDLDGSVRGMDFGTYGHYVEGGGNLTVWIANHFSLGAGYKVINAQLQDSNSATSSGLNVNLRGPMFSAGFKW